MDIDLSKYFLGNLPQAPDITDNRSVDDLMGASYDPNPGPLFPRQPIEQPVAQTPYQPRYDTNALANYMQSQQVPQGVQNRARIAALLAAIGSGGNWMEGLGRVGRGWHKPPADPMAGQRAYENTIKNWQMTRPQTIDPLKMLQYKRALSAADPNSPLSTNMRKALEEQGATVGAGMSYNEMIADPFLKQQIANMDPSKRSQIEKNEIETKIKKKEYEDKSAEASIGERKRFYINKINEYFGKEKVNETASLDYLEKLSQEIDQDPLKTKHAAAGAGKYVYGKSVSGAFEEEKFPEVAQANEKRILDLMDFIGPKNKDYATAVMNSDMPSKEKERILDPVMTEGLDEKKRQRQLAISVIKDLTDDKGKYIGVLAALKQIKNALRDSGGKGWDTITSSISNLKGGKIADWIVNMDIAKSDPKTQEVIRSMKVLQEAYGRPQSGAAIHDSEWSNFERQLGTQAFSNAESLYRSLTNMERYLRDTVASKWNSVHPKIQTEYSGQVQGLLPKQHNPNNVKLFQNAPTAE